MNDMPSSIYLLLNNDFQEPENYEGSYSLLNRLEASEKAVVST